jgi:hypothetical protein
MTHSNEAAPRAQQDPERAQEKHYDAVAAEYEMSRGAAERPPRGSRPQALARNTHGLPASGTYIEIVARGILNRGRE